MAAGEKGEASDSGSRLRKIKNSIVEVILASWCDKENCNIEALENKVRKKLDTL